MSPSTSIALLFLAILTATATAKEFQVGGNVGWRLPAVNETELYTTWASRRRFHIGDTLRFVYSTGSVVLVDKYGFYHCDASHPIEYYNDGNSVVKLDKLGVVYFISGDFYRCLDGQRMIVNVRNVHVRQFPPSVADQPSVAHPPYNPYYDMAPSPSQGLGTGAFKESGSAGLVSASVVALVLAVAGLGLCLVQF